MIAFPHEVVKQGQMRWRGSCVPACGGGDRFFPDSWRLGRGDAHPLREPRYCPRIVAGDRGSGYRFVNLRVV